MTCSLSILCGLVTIFAYEFLPGLLASANSSMRQSLPKTCLLFGGVAIIKLLWCTMCPMQINGWFIQNTIELVNNVYLWKNSLKHTRGYLALETFPSWGVEMVGRYCCCSLLWMLYEKPLFSLAGLVAMSFLWTESSAHSSHLVIV